MSCDHPFLRRVSSRRFLGALVALVVVMVMVTSHIVLAQSFVPATSATCDLFDLTDQHDLARVNPEWAPINVDAAHPLPNNLPNIVEGWVLEVPWTSADKPPAGQENENSQASAEV